MQQFDRRQGPRRNRVAEGTNGDQQVAAHERRGDDRRKSKPGIAALLGAIFGSARRERSSE